MKTFAVCLILIGLLGCSHTLHNSQELSSASPSVSNKSHRQINAIALDNVSPLQKVIPNLVNRKVVFVGERHTEYADHLNQLAIIKALHASWGAKTVIGVEFVQQPYQQVLDQYVQGEITDRELLLQSEWFERWGYDFRLYQPIFHYARQHKIPMVALNIPREISKRVSKVGLKGLSDKERAKLPQQIDKTNQAYRQKLKAVLGDHGPSTKMNFEHFYEAQLAWDEGMAEHAASYLQQNPAKHMVILAGSGHIANRHGIPSRLDRRLKSRSAVVLNNTAGTPSADQGDYMLFAKPESLAKTGKMGIMMGPAKNGVLIQKVIKSSASDKMGLKKGDVILSLDNKPVKRTQDVRIGLMNKKTKEKVAIIVLRSGKGKITKTLTLQ